MIEHTSSKGVSWDYVPRRVEGCACGGVLVSDPENLRQIASVVRTHQQTWRHKSWWASVERTGEWGRGE